MKRMLPINTHNKQNKKISQRGLAMCFGAGSISIDIGLNEYEPEKTTIHVRKGLVKLLLENERERERRGGKNFDRGHIWPKMEWQVHSLKLL